MGRECVFERKSVFESQIHFFPCPHSLPILSAVRMCVWEINVSVPELSPDMNQSVTWHAVFSHLSMWRSVWMWCTVKCNLPFPRFPAHLWPFPRNMPDRNFLKFWHKPNKTIHISAKSSPILCSSNPPLLQKSNTILSFQKSNANISFRTSVSITVWTALSVG